MDYLQQLQIWAKGEAMQGKIMIGFGLVFLVALFLIVKSENTFFRGGLIPVAIMTLVLIGYGSYILIDRVNHVNNKTEKVKENLHEAINSEIEKQEKGYESCKSLVRVYPILMLIAILFLIFVPSPYFKGLALGFVLLFISSYLIDSGFMSRSQPFLEYLKTLITK